MFLNAKNYIVDSKYLKVFLNDIHDRVMEYQDLTNNNHIHDFLFDTILGC